MKALVLAFALAATSCALGQNVNGVGVPTGSCQGPLQTYTNITATPPVVYVCGGSNGRTWTALGGGGAVLPAAGLVYATSSTTAVAATPLQVLNTLAPLPTAGLTADLHFMDGSGTVAADSSGNGNNGTLGTGGQAPTWLANGLAFTTGNTVPLPAALNTTQTFVIAAYLTPLIVGANGATVVPSNTTYPSFVTSSTGGSGFNLLYAYPVAGNGVAASAYAPGLYNSGFNTYSQMQLTGFHVFIYVMGTGSGSLDHIYVDGTEVASYLSQGATAGAQTSGNLCLGTCNAAPFTNMGLTGALYRFATYSTQLTAAQAATVNGLVVADLAARGVPTSPKPTPTIAQTLFAIGDSITYGLTLATPGTQAWPWNLALTNAPAYTVVDGGLSGVTALAFSGTEANRYAPSCQSANGPNAAVTFAGTNDFSVGNGAFNPTKVLGSLGAWIASLKATGCRVYVGTMLSRTATDSGGVSYDADKNAYDALILTQAKSLGADGIIDFAANPLLGADGANASATYFAADHIHPTAAGHLLLAAAASNSLNYYNGYKASNPRIYTATATMASGDAFVTAAPTAAMALTLPDCTGPSGETYTISNPQAAFAVTVTGGTSQPINGLSSAITIPNNATVTLRDVPNAKTVSGCHWAL